MDFLDQSSLLIFQTNWNRHLHFRSSRPMSLHQMNLRKDIALFPFSRRLSYILLQQSFFCFCSRAIYWLVDSWTFVPSLYRFSPFTILKYQHKYWKTRNILVPLMLKADEQAPGITPIDKDVKTWFALLYPTTALRICSVNWVLGFLLSTGDPSKNLEGIVWVELELCMMWFNFFEVASLNLYLVNYYFCN